MGSCGASRSGAGRVLLTRVRAQASRALSLLTGSRFARGVSLLAGSAAISQALLILASPLITRLYTPAEMGVYAVFTSILAVANSFGSMRYERAIPLPREPERGLSVVLLSLALLPVSAVVFGVLLLFGGRWLVGALGVPALGPFLWLLPVGLASIGTYHALSYWFVRTGDFKRIAWTRLTQSANMIGVKVLGGVLFAGPVGLLVGGIIGQAAGITRFAVGLRRSGRRLFTREVARGVPEVARAYRQFPMLTAWTQAINAAGVSAPSLLLAAFYGPQVAGWYALGQRVLAGPARIVGAAIAQVYFSEAARMMHERPAALAPQFRRLTRRLVLASVPIVAVSIVSPWLFEWVFGREWRSAGVYAAILALPVSCSLVATSTSNLVTYGFNKWASSWEVSRLVLTVGALWGCHWARVDSLGAISCLALVSVVSYSVLWLLNSTAVHRVGRAGWVVGGVEAPAGQAGSEPD